MNRLTKEFTTSITQKVLVVKEFLTEAENRQTMTALSSSMEMVDGVMKAKSLDMAKMFEYQDKLIEMWTISFDGSEENIIGRITELRKEEYKEIIDFITKLSGELEKKTL